MEKQIISQLFKVLLMLLDLVEWVSYTKYSNYETHKAVQTTQCTSPMRVICRCTYMFNVIVLTFHTRGSISFWRGEGRKGGHLPPLRKPPLYK